MKTYCYETLTDKRGRIVVGQGEYVSESYAADIASMLGVEPGSYFEVLNFDYDKALEVVKKSIRAECLYPEKHPQIWVKEIRGSLFIFALYSFTRYGGSLIDPKTTSVYVDPDTDIGYYER